MTMHVFGEAGFEDLKKTLAFSFGKWVKAVHHALFGRIETTSLDRKTQKRDKNSSLSLKKSIW
jgi:hypothetical protein